jgi:hypothetical protein
MLTFHRPDDLRAVIPLLLLQAEDVESRSWPHGRPVEVGIVIVDNDPAGSGEAVVRSFAGPVRYVVEPLPGIAAARNRALDETTDADVLVFIDDDERPHDGWLASLYATHLATGAAAVAGPVVSEFVGELDPWVAAGAFFRRRRLPTGTPISVAATNNLLIDRSQTDRLGLRFDRRFGMSGADDTFFTSSLARSGARLVWCDEAVVSDVVPAERMTRSWVVRRAFSSGNSASLVAVALHDGAVSRAGVRLRQLGHAALRGAGGGGQLAAGLLLRSPHHQTRGARTFARGAGMVAGILGLSYQEYGAADQRGRGLRRLGAVDPSLIRPL